MIERATHKIKIYTADIHSIIYTVYVDGALILVGTDSDILR